VLFARKGEKALEELERRRQAFLQLGHRVKNFVRIDATRPFHVVYDEVSGLIEQGYRNRRANPDCGLRFRLQRLGKLFD
jgi:thymidylate kinase